MSNGTFTYHDCDGSQNFIDFVRVLISDTNEFLTDPKTGQPTTVRGYIFSDQEIIGMGQVVSNQFQSSMFYTQPAGRVALPSQPVNYYRTAATLLNSIAANSGRLAAIKKMLDVELDASKAAQEMRATAQSYLDLDDNSGAFVIIEQVHDVWTFRERYWKQVMRQQGVIG